MHRTNIYLSDDQEQELDARARAERTTRSRLIRDLIDRELGAARPAPARVEGLDELARRYHDLTGDLFADDPDLRID